MFFKVKVFLATVVFFVGCPCIDGGGPSRACGAPTWPERFQTEAPQAWDKYRARAKRLQGSFSGTFFSLLLRKTNERRGMELKQRNGCALVVHQGHTEETEKGRTAQVHVINSRYSFSLRRQASSDGWAMSMLSKKSSGKNEIFQDPPDVDIDLWSTIAINFGLAYPTLRVIPTAPEFSLKGISAETREGRDLVKVEFEYAAPKDKPRVPSLAGWALYDPVRYWVLAAFDVQQTWTAPAGQTGRRAVTYEFQDTPDGYPIPKRIVVHASSNPRDGSFQTENTYDFDFREGEVPESDFTLSAFGLPEPKGMAPPKSSRWYLWFIAGGVICLGVGAFFRRRLQRKRSS